MNFEELLNHINESLRSDFSLVELGKLVGYSPWHLYKLFKFYTGEPLMSYIRRQRLKAAAAEVEDGRKMLDIAVDYGFETAAGFHKAFRKQFHCSPSQYKRSVLMLRRRQASPDITEIIYESEVTEMAKVIIRLLQKGDAQSLRDYIYVKNTREEVESRTEETLKKMDNGECMQVVALVDGTIVGTLVLQKEKHPPYFHCGQLGDEVINPAFDGLGIPSLLFEEAKKFGQKIGISIIKGSTRANYFTQRFFIENHFIEIGRIPGGIVESWNNKIFDEVLYYLPIE